MHKTGGFKAKIIRKKDVFNKGTLILSTIIEARFQQLMIPIIVIKDYMFVKVYYER